MIVGLLTPVKRTTGEIMARDAGRSSATRVAAPHRRPHPSPASRNPDAPTVVEGPQILPDLVPQGDQAVFLDPTPEWQRTVLLPRPMPSSDPARALDARLVKDRLYAHRVAALARERGFPVLVMDGSRDLVADVESLLEIPDGTADLRAVRRWENEAVASNLRAWLASPEAPREHHGYPFACECGRRGCGDTVQLTIEEFDTTPQVLAHA